MRQIALALLLVFCAADSVALKGDPRSSDAQAVRFIAFGDAGAGTGSQYAVAQAMKEVCDTLGCDFAVVLGDNIYPDGVHSARDLQFETKFEEPYADLDFPFFMALGNHDNGDDSAHNRYGDYEVEYAQRKDRKSDKWRMPARYYAFSAPIDGAPVGEPIVDLFALDSSPLAPYTDDPDPKWSPQVYGVAQLQWLEAALKRSTAPWKIAFSHHPYVSDGGHGNAGHYLAFHSRSKHVAGKPWRDLVEQTICKSGADLMLAGHDHDLEWLKPVSACGKTEFVVSGAGGAELTGFYNNDNPIWWQKSGRYGFFWFEVTRTRLRGDAFVLDNSAQLMRDAKGKPVASFERTLQR